jgi:hypothetical protein
MGRDEKQDDERARERTEMRGNETDIFVGNLRQDCCCCLLLLLQRRVNIEQYEHEQQFAKVSPERDVVTAVAAVATM